LALSLAHEPAVVVVDGLTLGLHGHDAADCARFCRIVHDRGVAMLISNRNHESAPGNSACRRRTELDWRGQ